MKTISDDLCEYCLPDCNITIYETSVSSAPFQPCDHTNLESASMCKMFGSEFNPPPWFNDIKNQYQGIMKKVLVSTGCVNSDYYFQIHIFRVL